MRINSKQLLTKWRWLPFCLFIAVAGITLQNLSSVAAQPHLDTNPEFQAEFFQSGGSGRLDSLQIRPLNREETWDDEIAWGCRGDHIYSFDSARSNLSPDGGPPVIVFSRDPRAGCNERIITVDMVKPPGYGESQDILHAQHSRAGGLGEHFVLSIANSDLLTDIIDDDDDIGPPPGDESCAPSSLFYTIAATDTEIRYPHGAIEIPAGADHLAIHNTSDNKTSWFLGYRPGTNDATYGTAGGTVEMTVSRLEPGVTNINGSPHCISNESIAVVFLENVGDEFGQPEDIGDGESETGLQCEATGLYGFFMCSFILEMVDGLRWVQESIVELLFETEPISLNVTDNPLYSVWSNIRDLANILLVVAFMAVVFSMATSLNIDAYTVKRMVPKLLVAAITIQASYFISAIFVDITNVLGGGLQGLTSITFEGESVQTEFDGDDWKEVAGSAGLAATGGLLVAIVVGLIGLLVAGVAQGGIMFLGMLLLVMFLVVLGAFIIVALRDLLIMMSIILSPFAFLANLLPATERWFKFWWSNFARLLLMYPFIILMIQMGNIGSYLILTGATNTAPFLVGFMALLLQLVAFGSIFLAFKVGGSLLSVVTGGAQKFLRGGGGGGGKGKEGKGLRGRMSKNIADGKQKLGTGDAGNVASRFLASPGRSLARGAGNVAGVRRVVGTKSRGLQAAQSQAAMAETAKFMEENNISGGALSDFIEHGQSGFALDKHISKLRSQGKTAQASELEGMRDFAGKKSAVGAALMRYGAQGRFDSLSKHTDAFQAAEKYMGGDSQLFQHAKLEAAKAAKDAGRQDVWGKHGPLPDDGMGKTVMGMGVEDWNKVSPKVFEQDEFNAALQDMTGTDEGRRQLRRTLSSPMMDPSKRAAILDAAGIPDTDPGAPASFGGTGTPNAGGAGGSPPTPPAPPTPRIIRPGDDDFHVPPGSRPS